MNKKISLGIVVLVLCLIGGGLFYWWQNQADVRELNKTLPDGVKVVKSLVGNEYKVANKIDGYEFEIPPEWEGIKEIEYIPKLTEEEYEVTSINIKSKKDAKLVAIDRFKAEKKAILIDTATEIFKYYELSGNFVQDIIGEINIVKTQENIHLGGMYVYFFNKEPIVYTITAGSEEFIRYIIANGKW